MKRFSRQVMAIPFLFMATVGAADAAELRGSRASMKRQHGVAIEAGYSFVRTPTEVRELTDDGQLVRLDGNDDYTSLARYSYALPETRTFIERLGAQYRERTGEKLVVTSLVRPTTRQPPNAHRLSVHPAGMAVDLRVPRNAAHRRWLEGKLLGLERADVLDVTRERNPPHYHVAVFPGEYNAYIEALESPRAEEAGGGSAVIGSERTGAATEAAPAGSVGLATSSSKAGMFLGLGAVLILVSGIIMRWRRVLVPRSSAVARVVAEQIGAITVAVAELARTPTVRVRALIGTLIPLARDRRE